MGDFIKVTGLWKNTSKTGNTYLSGKIEGIGKVFVMANKHKKPGEKYPDYYIYKSGDDAPAATEVAQQDFMSDLNNGNDDVPF